MSEYENLRHGTADFPAGIHDTACGNGFRLYPHIHREFEILVLTKGSGKMYVDEGEFLLKEGDGIFVNSRAVHLGVQTDRNPCEFFALVFAPEILGSLGNDAVMNRYILPVMNNKVSFPAYYNRAVDWQAEVLRLAEHIHELGIAKPPGYELSVKAELLCIWRLCFTHGKAETGTRGRALEEIKTALEFIRDEYASPLTLGEIAAKASMSQGYFCRRFSSIMRMTVFEYLLKIRIDNSCRLLRDTDLPVGEIAARCGFNGSSYFTKKFRELVGCTPMEFRNKK